MQGFLTAILLMMLVSNSCMLVAYSQKSLVQDEFQCSIWRREHRWRFLALNVWGVLFYLFNWIFV